MSNPADGNVGLAWSLDDSVAKGALEFLAPIGPVPAAIDLAFLAAGGRDDDARLGRRRAAQRSDKAAHARVLGGKAVIVDEGTG